MLDYGGFPVMSDVPILMATMMRWIDAISKFLLVPNVSASSVSAWPSSPSFPRIGAASAATMPSIVAIWLRDISGCGPSAKICRRSAPSVVSMSPLFTWQVISTFVDLFLIWFCFLTLLSRFQANRQANFHDTYPIKLIIEPTIWSTRNSSHHEYSYVHFFLLVWNFGYQLDLEIETNSEFLS